MVAISQGDVWWTDLAEPVGSGPGFKRPVVIVQSNALNRSQLPTVVCVALTSNLAWADAPGNSLLQAKHTGLPKDAVANASQIVTLDRDLLVEKVCALTKKQLDTIINGIGVVLGQ